MELIMEQFPIVIQSLNVGFLQTLKLFFVTLLGALPLGLIIAFGSMSHFRPLKYITNIIVTAIFCIMLLDRHINRIEGIILLIGMAVYIAAMVISALKNRETADECKMLSLPKSLIFIIGGLIAVIFGGTLVVDNACLIAKDFGVSENFIGLTIIAIGTSLPELVTSITATRKGDSGLALGNAIGSNLFNILFILGMSATICPLNVLSESIIDCIILLVSAVILYVFARTKKTMNRWEGIVCVFLYVGYTAYLLIR